MPLTTCAECGRRHSDFASDCPRCGRPHHRQANGHDEYLRTLLDALPSVVFTQDAEGRIRMANQATAAVLGRSIDGIIGELHREISPFPEDVTRLEEQIRFTLRTGEGTTIERSVSHPVSGDPHSFETRVVPLQPPDGGTLQALVVATDITAHRKSEEALLQAHREVIARLSQAAEFRDDDTGHHTRRVGTLAADIARYLGRPPEEVELIRLAAPLHDVGKIGIPDSILLKPAKLTEEEFSVMKTHTIIGGRILSGSSSELMRLAEQIAVSHHERWDGNGYPQRLGMDDIHFAARVVGVADVADALSHPRPYRPAWPPGEVIRELKRNRGRHFDPDCVDACLEVLGSEEKWTRWAAA